MFYGILWNNHRKFSFNTNTLPPSGDDDTASWENEDNFDIYGGAHGLQRVEVSGELRSDTCYNKLLNNSYANKWDEHVNFNFIDHKIGEPDFNEHSPHGLNPVNFAVLPLSATELEIEEHDRYNKIVNNRLIRDLITNLSKKPTTFVKKILKDDWALNLYEPGVYKYVIFHGLDTETIGLSLFHMRERITSDGSIEMCKALFSPEDIYLISNNEVEIHTTNPTDIDVILWCQSEYLEGKSFEKVTGEDNGSN